MIDIIIRIVVVLPAPFGPMKPYSAPRGTTRSRWSTALVAPNVLVTPLRRTAAFMRLQIPVEEGGCYHAARGRSR